MICRSRNVQLNNILLNFGNHNQAIPNASQREKNSTDLHRTICLNPYIFIFAVHLHRPLSRQAATSGEIELLARSGGTRDCL